MSMLLKAFKSLPDSWKNNLIKEYVKQLTPKEKKKMAKDNAMLLLDEFFNHLTPSDMRQLVKRLDEKQYRILKHIVNDPEK